MNVDEDPLKLFAIFFPYATERRRKILESKTRFVHYCSAEAAYSIFKSRHVWLRNVGVMNDFLEVDHGVHCLRTTWDGPSGKKLRQSLDKAHPGLCDECFKYILKYIPRIRNDTYITCLSEHDDSEDELGRLSMWRAYGGPTGVAVIVNPGVFMRSSNALSAFTSPVAYYALEEFRMEFEKVTQEIERNARYLGKIGRNICRDYLISAILAAVVCTKHRGFKEEREWRVIYPIYLPLGEIMPSVEVIHGIPQTIYSIPLRDDPKGALEGAELPKLINRIIVGPTEFPLQVRSAMIRLLHDVGVPDAEAKVVCSDIPLRR